MPGCMSEAPRPDVLDLKDEALLQALKDEGLAARFYWPTAAEWQGAQPPAGQGRRSAREPAQ